jgi:hypothetical protein
MHFLLTFAGRIRGTAFVKDIANSRTRRPPLQGSYLPDWLTARLDTGNARRP